VPPFEDWITLIGGLAGWRAVFPNKKREFRRAAQKTEGRAGRLQNRAFRQAFPQPAGPPVCAAHWPALLCSLPARPSVQPTENSCYSFGNTALQPAQEMRTDQPGQD